MNMNNENIIKAYENLGLYGLILTLEKNITSEVNARVKAYNLLKAGRTIARKSPYKSLKYLPLVAYDLSRHESIYRAAAFLYIELNDIEKASECLYYLHYYYQNTNSIVHTHYNIIKSKLIKHYGSSSVVDSLIVENEIYYQQQNILCNLKNNSISLPIDSINEQVDYFKELYQKYDANTVIASIQHDVRLNNRQKAVLLIRASRAVGAVAEEGSSIESLFANEAIKLNDSATVINNIYQAYMRAGDLNQLANLKEKYPDI